MRDLRFFRSIKTVVAGFIATTLFFTTVSFARADETPTPELTPVPSAISYDASPRVSVVESQAGIGARLSAEVGATIPLPGIAAGHDSALVRISVLDVAAATTVFAAGAPALVVDKGSASTTVLVPVVNGAIEVHGIAPADLRIELLASFAGDPTAPGSTIALPTPVTRADTAVDLADGALTSEPTKVGVVGLGGVPATGVRAVYVTALVSVATATSLTIGEVSVPIAAGRTAVTTTATPSEDGTVPVSIADGQGSLRVDVRGWIPEAAQGAEFSNIVGSYVPASGAGAISRTVTDDAPVSVDLGQPRDAALSLVLVSSSRPTDVTAVSVGSQSAGRTQGAIADPQAGALPQLMLAAPTETQILIHRGQAEVTVVPLGAFLAAESPRGEGPSMVIEGPSDGSRVDLSETGAFTIHGTVTTPDVSVRSVQISTDGSVIGSAQLRYADGRQTWSFDTSAPTAGTHRFTVTATDRAGRTASETVTIEAVLPTEEEVIISDDAVVLPEAEQGQPVVASLTDDAVVLGIEPDFKPGDVIVSDAAPHAPQGFLRRVVAIDQIEGQWKVTTEPAVITDVILQADVDEEVDLITSDAIIQPTAPGTDPDVEFVDEGVDDVSLLEARPVARTFGLRALDASAGSDISVGQEVESRIAIVYYQEKSSDKVKVKDLSRSKTWEKGAGLESKVQIEAKAKFTLKLHVKVDIDLSLSWGIPKVDTKEFSVYTATTIESSVKLEAQVKWALAKKYEREFASFPFGSFAFAIGPVPIVINVDGSLSMTAEVSLTLNASVSFEQSWKAKTGFSYSTKSGYKEIDESTQSGGGPLLEPTLALSASAKLLGEAGPKLQISFMIYDVAGPYLEAGVAAGFSAELSGRATIDGKASIEFEAEVYVKASGAIGVLFQIPVIDFTIFDGKFPIEGKWSLVTGIKFSAPLGNESSDGGTDPKDPGPTDPPGAGEDPEGYSLSKVVDPALRQCIADAADVSISGTLDESSIESVSQLSCPNMGIRSLRGMPDLPSLTVLDLEDNGLVSWEGMPDLPNLRYLSLGGNGLVSWEG
ncbi:MAG TPA: hypothetical protein PKA68_16225, partial [Arachnia sp.]|nr:hypothetical protein [Arachnia sp.]